ncbi:hypothetical protein CBR_g48698 [Chara braunii]|uniref:Uncharacterized protein n=1 Tax=Chara braunii TaxID=69332 RepID=A0A388K4K9_CHABU|nr:hypothetical protein CBR_g48698 [Chara braunii]|eukprot:GBG64949.1 hypothetical protein CBR_g48698 [Chara braunii]
MDLKQSRRKTIRQERKKIKLQGLTLKRLRGNDIKVMIIVGWGQVYLTREFFHMIGSRMGDQVMLIIAEDSVGRMVGGALNFVGEDSLFGRNWGCRPGTYYDCLHFEACYYQVDMEMDLLNQCNPFKDRTKSSQA